ncbi:torsin-1A-like isoform X2 [Engystomops pustulosus]
MQNEDRVKPLVLSFHGLTGSGKSYTARILAKHFNPMGLDSKFVHKIVTTLSFPHESEIKTYKDQLHAWIRGNVSRCERSLFIFEDVNKMHPELLHSLRPYLDYHDKIDGVSYRKCIFIFTSETGANVISDYALEVWRQGKRREEIQLFDVQRLLTSHLLKARNTLQEDLDNRLFGQHLAREVILSLMQNEDRVKPLVLSFHGLTGSGKSYTARILAKHFNPMGLDSKFVHKIVTTLSFPHESEVKTYKDQLHAWIRGNVSRCERSLFIFEDVNKMHPELLHSLRPYLDYHDKIDGVSYRKCIFIFTSDTGANVISDYALEVRSQGKRRKEIKLFDVQRILTSHLLKARNSEFYDCDLIKNKVIDIFVPFLPLDLKHVKMCVRAELERQERTEDEEFVSRVVEEMDYYPKGEKVYCKNGCKNVHVRVDLPYPTALQLAFDKNIFGQHLAKQAIPNAVSQFLNNETPKKPLVLSLHGRTGTSRTFTLSTCGKSAYIDLWHRFTFRTSSKSKNTRTSFMPGSEAMYHAVNVLSSYLMMCT